MRRDRENITQREFWVRIRRALILIIDTIEDQYALPHVRPADFPPIESAPRQNGAAPQSGIPRQDAQSPSIPQERER